MNKIGAIVVREIREALPATIFFLFLFHLIGLTKAVSLNDYSITALRAAGATMAALIVAKAILLVEALPIAQLSSGRRISQVVWKRSCVAWWRCCSGSSKNSSPSPRSMATW